MQKVAVVHADATCCELWYAQGQFVHCLQPEPCDANVSGFPQEMLARRSPAHAAVMFCTAVAAQDHYRSICQRTQRFQRCQQLRIQLKNPTAMAHKLVPLEVHTDVPHGASPKSSSLNYRDSSWESYDQSMRELKS